MTKEHSPSSECTLQRILHVHDIEPTNVLFSVDDDTRTTHVATASDHDDVAGVELGKLGQLASLDVVLDGVVDGDEGVGVTDGAAVVCDNVGDASSTEGDLLHLEELVGGLLRSDTVDNEATLDIVEDAEVLAGFFDGDDICKCQSENGGFFCNMAYDAPMKPVG